MTDLAGLIMNEDMSELLQEALRRKQAATSAKSKSGSGGPGGSKTSSKTPSKSAKPSQVKDVEYGGGGKTGQGEGGMMQRTGVGERPRASGRDAFLDRDIHGGRRKNRAEYDEEARAADFNWDMRSPGVPDGMPMAANPDIHSGGQDAVAPRKGFVGSRGTSVSDADTDETTPDVDAPTDANEDQGVLDWITQKVFGDGDGDEDRGTPTEGRNEGRTRNRSTPAPDGAPTASTDGSRQRRAPRITTDTPLEPQDERLQLPPLDPSQRVQNKVYKSHDGRPVVWTGEGFLYVDD